MWKPKVSQHLSSDLSLGKISVNLCGKSTLEALMFCGIQALAFKRVFCSGDQHQRFLCCYMYSGIILKNNLKTVLLVKTCSDAVMKRGEEAMKEAGPIPEYSHNSIS